MIRVAAVGCARLVGVAPRFLAPFDTLSGGTMAMSDQVAANAAGEAR